MFHINPETGDVGTCRARQGKCPYGTLDEHFTTAEAARAHFENQQTSKPQIKGTETYEPVTYDILSSNLPLAEDAIAKANRRLEKAGVAERFTFETEEYMETEIDPKTGMTIATPRIRLKLNTPGVKFEGYTFLASVEKAEAGFVVKAATGYDLHGFSPNSLKCDACGKAIGRQKTYLVQDDDGNNLQVGSSCVKNYFGVDVKGLWALSHDPLERAKASDKWQTSRAGLHDSAIPTEDILAYALAVSEGGENFVSGTSARNWGGRSTADEVRAALYGTDTKWSQQVQEDAEKYRAEAKRLLEKFKNYSHDSDYRRNMSVIASGEFTKWNHMNILVSGLSEIAHEKREAAKKAHAEKWGTPTPGYAGEIGEKLKGRKLKVYKIFDRTKTDPYSYRDREIEYSQVIFRDEDNHEVVWWAPRRIFLEEGAEVEVLGGSVKKHGSYNGVDQTTIQRVKLSDEGEMKTSDDSY